MYVLRIPARILPKPHSLRIHVSRKTPIPDPRQTGRDGPNAAFRRRWSRELDEIVLMALRKEPGLRYPTVEQLADDLRNHLEGRPVAAIKGSWKYRARKFVARHRIVVATGVALTLALIAGVGATVREARIAAANQRRAEQRFDDVRKLANSLMFEIHDSIEPLPGATPARKLLVQRSLEYLNSLSSEASGDISLQRELANAYERIGLVQGNPQGANLGDVAGALDSFTKALSVRQKIADAGRERNISDAVALAESNRELCGMQAVYLGSIGKALFYCGKDLALTEQLYRDHPHDAAVIAALAKAHESAGRLSGESSSGGSTGDSYSALDHHRKALDLVEQLAGASPGNPDLQNWRGRLSLLTGDDLLETGKNSQALPFHQKAVQTFEALTAASANPKYGRALLVAYQRMGDTLLVDGNFAQSVPYYRKQLEIAQKLAAEDPKNMQFSTDVAASRTTLGHGLWRSGKIAQGLAEFHEALASLASRDQNDSMVRGLQATIHTWMAGALEKQGRTGEALQAYVLAQSAYSAICATDPNDVEDCLGSSGTLSRIAGIHLRQGAAGEAENEYRMALAVAEPLAQREMPNLEALYAIVNLYYGLGEVSQAQSHRQACVWYAKAKAANARISEWHSITPDEFDARDPRDIEARLRQCQPSAASGTHLLILELSLPCHQTGLRITRKHPPSV